MGSAVSVETGAESPGEMSKASRTATWFEKQGLHFGDEELEREFLYQVMNSLGEGERGGETERVNKGVCVSAGTEGWGRCRSLGWYWWAEGYGQIDGLASWLADWLGDAWLDGCC
jgi:hypothetical protein